MKKNTERAWWSLPLSDCAVTTERPPAAAAILPLLAIPALLIGALPGGNVLKGQVLAVWTAGMSAFFLGMAACWWRAGFRSRSAALWLGGGVLALFSLLCWLPLQNVPSWHGGGSDFRLSSPACAVVVTAAAGLATLLARALAPQFVSYWQRQASPSVK